MRRRWSWILVLTWGAAGLWSCNSSDPAPMPSITSFSPDSGPALSTVTILGSNFSPDKSTNIVRFNGVNAEVTASSPGSLSVTVPAGATSGIITVTVNGQSAVSQAPFTLNPLVGTWRFTGYSATNCSDPANDEAITCTVDCATLTFTATTVVFAAGGSLYNFTYTLTATTLTIISPAGGFSPTYVYTGGQLTLVYPPGDCSYTETYVKI